MAKKSEAIEVVGKKKLESEVVLYSGSPEISKELEKAQTLSKSDFYNVAGKTVPSARSLQWLANRKNIKTKIIDVESTRDYCRATVAGWIGNNPNPESNQIYKEATVEMMFDVELADKLLDIIRKNFLKQGQDWEIGDTGMPVLTNPKYQDKMMREMLRMRKFALRTMVTKAERIIHSKLADVEWQDNDELADERHEVELVSGKEIDVPKASKQPKVVKQCACGNPLPDDNTSGLCAMCLRKSKSKPKKSKAKKERKAEVVKEDDKRTEDESDGETPKMVVEETEQSDSEESEETKTIIPASLIKGIKKPRDALDKILEYAMKLEKLDKVKPVIVKHYEIYADGSRSPLHIPEPNVIAIVKDLTGLKLKKSEKSLVCSNKGCNNKMTEPEADDQEVKGKSVCFDCYMKED